jgi:hypothetical protein
MKTRLTQHIVLNSDQGNNPVLKGHHQHIVLNSDQGNNPVLKGHHLAQIFFFKKNETTL